MHRAALRAVQHLLLITVFLTACVSVTPAPAPGETAVASTQAPAGTPTPTGARLAGDVVWGSEPVPGARVELRALDWHTNQKPPVATTVADMDGFYVLREAPVGEFAVVGVWPDGQDGAAASPEVAIAAGQVISGFTVALERELEVVEPAIGTQVAAAPTLKWRALPAAATYRVRVINAVTTEVMVDSTIAEISLAIDAPLASGQTYDWIVNAMSGDGASLATLKGRFTLK